MDKLKTKPKAKTVDERIAQLYMAITEISHNLVTLDNRVTKLESIRPAEPEEEHNE